MHKLQISQYMYPQNQLDEWMLTIQKDSPSHLGYNVPTTHGKLLLSECGVTLPKPPQPVESTSFHKD